MRAADMLAIGAPLGCCFLLRTWGRDILARLVLDHLGKISGGSRRAEDRGIRTAQATVVEAGEELVRILTSARGSEPEIRCAFRRGQQFSSSHGGKSAKPQGTTCAPPLSTSPASW